MADSSSKQRLRKDPATDITSRITQLQRRNAADSKPRPKAERPPLPSSSKPQEKSAYKDDFARTPRDEFARNMLATPPRLFNPDMDPIPMRRTYEPEQIAEPVQRSPPRGVAHRSVRPEPSSRRLFDPKRDSPIPFAVANKAESSQDTTPRPQAVHRSSGDYLSASSTSMSSYPPSLGSSAFTLSQTSSSSSAQFRDKEDPNSPVVAQLKRLYRQISQMEKRLQEERIDSDDRPVIVQSRDQPAHQESDKQKNADKWHKLISEHKELAELMHNFLTLTLSPQVPVSFHSYPASCNIPSRLWNSFHRILESLRRHSLTEAVALELLSDLIYYCYNFYAGLLENPVVDSFRVQWLEALGDLARYRMMVASHISGSTWDKSDELVSPMFTEGEPQTRIDDSPSPSVGPTAAKLLDVEPERETWRKTARSWYGQALKEVPGQGRLHHHLGVVSRESQEEDMRAVYHFVKSTMTSNAFHTSRESVLVMFTPESQARRAQPDARTGDLFLLLQGMLITHVQLDDFAPTHARFMERLALEGAEDREWIMMALINIGSLFEYGRHDGALRNATANATLGAGSPAAQSPAAQITAVVNRTDELKIDDFAGDKKMEVDDGGESNTPRNIYPPTPEVSHTFHLALSLTFGTLSHALRNPWRKINAFTRPSLNPYITVILTFLSTIVKHPAELALLERAIPWDDLASFFNTIPRGIVQAETEYVAKSLTHGCSVLPEDWCMRGTEWMRRVYDRGFWKAETGGGEVEVLDMGENNSDALSDGIIEDDDEETSNRPNFIKLRWVRCFRSAMQLVKSVEGLTFDRAAKRWAVEGDLRGKMEMWKEIERKEHEEEEARRMRVVKWEDDDMEVDEEEEEDDDDSYDEEDDEQVRELKARRRHYRALLRAQNNGRSKRRAPRSSSSAYSRIPVHVVAGYSVLVVDTNILLSSLSMFATLVESMRWTVIVPLAVVTELDGLSSKSDNAQLGTAAKSALTYLISHLRSHTLSLKVQTSRGNYLTSLSVRREQVDLRNELSWERNMDDLILKAAIWQDEHWVDRSALLKVEETASEEKSKAARVVLLTFDRNLRLKARSRQLEAADEKDMASILAT